MKDKIKLYVITGVLGSGKTTFLKRVLENFSDKKTGVLVNEFGVIGIDGKTINRDGLEYVEVNNGSVFCSCIKANFLKTLVELQKLDIDVLVIESTGLADPSSMNGLLDELEKFMDRGYEYIGSVCIVDSSTFLRYVDMLPQLQNQVAASQFIILNKTDVADKQTIESVKNRISEINSSAFVIEAVQADIPLELLESKLSNSGFDADSYNKPCNRVATYTIKLSKQYVKSSIEAFTRGLAPYAVRIKGFVQTDQGWIHVDIVHDDYAFRNVDEADDELKAKQCIVIIGKDGTEFDDTVTALWQEYTGELPNYIEEE